MLPNGAGKRRNIRLCALNFTRSLRTRLSLRPVTKLLLVFLLLLLLPLLR